MSPVLSIIILNWNGIKYLNDCLSSVFDQTYDNFRVIFVDNHSSDDSVDFVRQNFPNAEIIALDKNYGFAKANNLGIKYTLEKYNPDYIFLLNTDTRLVQRESLQRLIEIAKNDKKIGILGCKLIFPDGTIQHVGTTISILSPFAVKWISPFKKTPQEPYEVYATLGAAFLVKRIVVDRIGLLDEGFSPMYCEETDYCVRARRAGFLVKMTYSVEIVHYLAGSAKNQPQDYLELIFKTNNVRFALLNFPLLLLIVKALYECYTLLKYLPGNILERKDKGVSLTLTNLKIKQNWKNNLMHILTPYFINTKNIQEIIYKRIFRTQKIYY